MKTRAKMLYAGLACAAIAGAASGLVPLANIVWGT
jgi:hypothetical protein